MSIGGHVELKDELCSQPEMIEVKRSQLVEHGLNRHFKQNIVLIITYIRVKC